MVIGGREIVWPGAPLPEVVLDGVVVELPPAPVPIERGSAFPFPFTGESNEDEVGKLYDEGVGGAPNDAFEPVREIA